MIDFMPHNIWDTLSLCIPLFQINCFSFVEIQNSLDMHYYVPHQRGGGHIVFGAVPVGAGVGVGVSVGLTFSCLHDIL